MLENVAVTVTWVAPASSATLAGFTDRFTAGASSSSLMVPVPVSVDVTLAFETLKPTVKVSLPSTSASSVVCTVKVWVSLAVPMNVNAAVFSV